jgi:hypothetical protein
MINKKYFARFLADSCIRNNTSIENIHAGKSLPNKYLKGYSRITEKEMHNLMLQIAHNLTITLQQFIVCTDEERAFGAYSDEEFSKHLKKIYFGKYGVSWDNPTLNKKGKNEKSASKSKN